jgi:hypothetical protein
LAGEGWVQARSVGSARASFSLAFPRDTRPAAGTLSECPSR